jgi:hypothetical protein
MGPDLGEARNETAFQRMFVPRALPAPDRIDVQARIVHGEPFSISLGAAFSEGLPA